MSQGKGSKRRPMGIKQEDFNERWDEVFKKKDDKSSIILLIRDEKGSKLTCELDD